jgi:hypothetical protein
MEDTYTKVKSAFYSGEHAFTGDNQTASDIAFLVDNGYLGLRVFPLATRQEYLAILQNLPDQEHIYEAAGGSETHVALKLLAGNYLKHKYNQKLLYEHPFCGYFPDVMTADSRIIVECGHTNNPEKMLIYFGQSALEECLLVPYPDPDEQQVFAYSFKALNELRDFLAFWESEKHSDIRKKLQQRQ